MVVAERHKDVLTADLQGDGDDRDKVDRHRGQGSSLAGVAKRVIATTSGAGRRLRLWSRLTVRLETVRRATHATRHRGPTSRES